MRKMDEKDAKAALEQCAENNAKLWLLMRDAQNALLDSQIKNDELQATLAAEREAHRALVAAALAVLYNASGIGKAGGTPEDDEYVSNLDAMRDALAALDAGKGEGES